LANDNFQKEAVQDYILHIARTAFFKAELGQLQEMKMQCWTLCYLEGKYQEWSQCFSLVDACVMNSQYTYNEDRVTK